MDILSVLFAPSQSMPSPNNSFYITGGTLPADATSYVERQADKDLLSALLAGGYCYVLHSPPIGKTSLSLRTISPLPGNSIKTTLIPPPPNGAHNNTPLKQDPRLLW